MKWSAAARLFIGTTLTAAGYGATFLLTAYFQERGGNEFSTAAVLSAALAGTFAGVPIVAWGTGRVDATRFVACAALALACGYLMLAVTAGSFSSRVAGLLIGLGWGMFYLSAPMALSERIRDIERALWFTRFSAFQMAGICGGPALLSAVVAAGKVRIEEAFLGVTVATSIAAALLWSFGSRERIVIERRQTGPWVRMFVRLVRSEAIIPIAMVGMGGGVFSGVMAFQSSFVAGTSATAQHYFAWHAATAIAARVSLGRTLASAPQKPIVVALLSVMTVGVIALLWMPRWPFLHLVSAVFTGFGYGLAYPLIQARAVNEAPQDARHAALCWFVMSYFVGLFGFPVVGVAILMHFGKGHLIATIAVLGAIETLAALLVGSRFKTIVRTAGADVGQTR